MILQILSKLDVLKVPPTLECVVIQFPGGRREIQMDTSKQILFAERRNLYLR